ncbi:MAG: element excision factor XisH family protein [Blastocatellia bacterium]
MPQHDTHHETVKHALLRDGWTITADPFVIQFGKTRMYADLCAEKNVRVIIVEIKGFARDSFVNELHRATGQYGNYRTMLQRTGADYEVWLAVPHDVYLQYFTDDHVRFILEDQQISLFTFNPETEEIVLWNN